MAVVVGLPRVHRRIGRRTMAFVAIAATVASIAGTKVRYDEPVIGWRTFVLIIAVAVLYLVSMPVRGEERALPGNSSASS
jgi:hypothetical protein